MTKELLDPKGYVLTDKHLNVPNHPEILAYGDIIYGGARNSYELDYGSTGTLKAWVNKVVIGGAGDLKEYKKPTGSPVLVVPISRLGGIAYVYGWILPSFFAKQGKGRTFKIENTAKVFS